MIRRRPHLSLGIALLFGMGLGWLMASARPNRLWAGGADRWGDRIVTTGPIAVEQTALKVQITKDAVYYLNYSNGLLLATIPSYTMSSNGTQILSDFAERDLVRDFGIGPGTNPHFLMTTGNLGATGQGWAPLFVFETETGQVATYQVIPQATAGSTKPVFQMLEKRTDRRLARAASTAR